MPLKAEYPSNLVLDKELILTPGASKSGFVSPSKVGPRLEKGAIVSSEGSIVLLSSTAPTVIAFLLVPGGERIVPLSGPLLPAATTTINPASTAFQQLYIMDPYHKYYWQEYQLIN